MAESESSELLAVKRVPPVRGRSTHSLVFRTPPFTTRAILRVFLMSDSYLGLDQEFCVPLNIIEALEKPELEEDSSVKEGKWMPPPIQGPLSAIKPCEKENDFPELQSQEAKQIEKSTKKKRNKKKNSD